MKTKNKEKEVVIYQAPNGAIELRGDVKKETIWATQAQMAFVFGVNPQAITKHLKNVYAEKELSKEATCSKMEQVQSEGGRAVRRAVEFYNLDTIISVGYRINSKTGTKFRKWATKTLRGYIAKGYAINPKRIKENYLEFQKALENIKKLLPKNAKVDNESVLELVSAFADTWLSLEAYDKDTLIGKGVTKKAVKLTGEQMIEALAGFKELLIKKKEATDLFGREKNPGEVAGIFGNVMQTFGGKELYPTLEEKAAHLSKLLRLCGHIMATSLSFSSLLQTGRTHLNRSSLIVFGIFIHMLQDYTSWKKPPYVCGHYLLLLTFSFWYATITR